MPWKGVPVSEQRGRSLEDFQLNYYSASELAESFGISRATAYTYLHPSGTSGHRGKWINRFKQHGQAGFGELSRDRPSITFLLSKDIA
jgi:transposase